MLLEPTQAAASATQFVRRAADDDGDPRESRKAFLAFAHEVADLAEKSEPLREAIRSVVDVMQAQGVSDADEEVARASGWPEIPACRAVR